MREEVNLLFSSRVSKHVFFLYLQQIHEVRANLLFRPFRSSPVKRDRGTNLFSFSFSRSLFPSVFWLVCRRSSSHVSRRTYTLQTALVRQQGTAQDVSKQLILSLSISLFFLFVLFFPSLVFSGSLGFAAGYFLVCLSVYNSLLLLRFKSKRPLLCALSFLLLRLFLVNLVLVPL